MRQDELISVIVPVYNVEKYIDIANNASGESMMKNILINA